MPQARTREIAHYHSDRQMGLTEEAVVLWIRQIEVCQSASYLDGREYLSQIVNTWPDWNPLYGKSPGNAEVFLNASRCFFVFRLISLIRV